MDTRRRAFSLVELVIVIAIIAVLAAIAAPRLSRGAAAAAENTLAQDLNVLRTAIDLYVLEHQGSYPSLLKFERLMLQCSDVGGTKFGARDAAQGLIYGPYLRAIPPLPVGVSAGNNDVVGSYTLNAGWIYDATDGTIKANCKPSEVDSFGKTYLSY